MAECSIRENGNQSANRLVRVRAMDGRVSKISIPPQVRAHLLTSNTRRLINFLFRWVKRSFWYSALRIPFYVPAVRDGERRPVYFKYLLDVTSILDITLPVLTSHYRAFPAVHFKQISHRHSEAIITPIRLCPHAYVRTIVHRTQTHTRVRCSSVRRRASATGCPCIALYRVRLCWPSA